MTVTGAADGTPMFDASRVLKESTGSEGMSEADLAWLRDRPEARQELYKGLLDASVSSYRPLLRQLLELEIDFRNALWEGKTEDDGEHYEGIYRCAYLLYRCAEPEDSLLLWRAKHINMDVGCSLGAEYFVGAGGAETTRFLEQSDHIDAVSVLEYVAGWLAEPAALGWQRGWEAEREANIRTA